jgi:hypothetical protein
MPRVPNRRHAHHLNPEDQRTAFIQMFDFRTSFPSAFLHKNIIMEEEGRGKRSSKIKHFCIY